MLSESAAQLLAQPDKKKPFINHLAGTIVRVTNNSEKINHYSDIKFTGITENFYKQLSFGWMNYGLSLFVSPSGLYFINSSVLKAFADILKANIDEKIQGFLSKYSYNLINHGQAFQSTTLCKSGTLVTRASSGTAYGSRDDFDSFKTSRLNYY